MTNDTARMKYRVSADNRTIHGWYTLVTRPLVTDILMNVDPSISVIVSMSGSIRWIAHVTSVTG